MNQEKKSKLPIFNLFEWIIALLSLITFISLGIIYHSSPFEIISVILGLFAAMLNMKRKKYAFIVYSLYVLIYGIMSLLQKQYGEGILNLAFNLPVYLYTVYRFYLSKKKTKEESFSISNLSYKGYIIVLLFVPIVTTGYGFLLSYLDSKLPFLNALATSFALLSCYLASKGNLSQWIFWICYSSSLVAIWTINYLEAGEAGLLYLVLNGVYIFLNTYSFVLWIKDYKKQKEEINKAKEISMEE